MEANKKARSKDVGTDTAASSASSPSSSSSSSIKTSFFLGPHVMEMPAIGLGTFQIRKEACYSAVQEALKKGYRHFDTAAVYRNEAEVGRAVRESGIPREEIFVTSKLAPRDQGEGKAYAAMEASLAELDLEYIDLYLIHWPGSSGIKTDDPRNRERRHGSYRDLQKGIEEGTIKSLGVSNFNEAHLAGLLADPSIQYPPKVNQVEFHPFYQQHSLRAYCQEDGILLQAYSSLGQMDASLRDHPTLQSIAKKHQGASPAQVLLRWALQHHVPVIPKTINPARMEANLACLHRPVLDAEDMKALDALDCGRKFAWNPEGVA